MAATYQEHLKNFFGGDAQKYADAIKANEAAGRAHSDPAATAAFKAANPGLFATGNTVSGYSPSMGNLSGITGAAAQQLSQALAGRSASSTQHSTATKPGVQTMTRPDAVVTPTTTTAQTGFPYERLINDLLSNRPTYTPMSESDMLSQASQYRALQIDPVLQDLSNRLAAIKTTTEGQRGAVEAAYSTVPQQTQLRLDEARKAALESAISRNMGRSGVVEHLTGQFTTPIMLEEQRLGAEKTAKLTSIADELASVENEIAQLRGGAVERGGQLESQRLAELRQQAQLQQQQQYSQDMAIAFQLAQLGVDWDTIQKTLGLNMLSA